MRLVRCWVAMGLCSFVLLGAENPFLGTWRLNAAKSKFSPGAEMQSMTLKFEAAGDGVKRTAEGTDGFGEPLSPVGGGAAGAAWDGKEHVISKAPQPVVAVTVKQVDEHTLTSVIKTNGKVTNRVKSVVSKDGKTMTTQDEGTNEKGVKFHNVEVFEKQ